MEKLEFDSLILEIFPTVYFPREDSFLLAKHSKNLKGKILDIGCGSGIQSLINAKYNPENEVIGLDLNEDAVKNSIHNAKLNNIHNADFFVSNLFSIFTDNKNKKNTEKFDAIIFNPPYLPTSKEERLKSKENLAYDGGINGRKVLDLFLEQFTDYLTSKGKLLLIQSSLNNLKKTEEILNKKKFKTEILDEEKFFFEKIYIISSSVYP